MFRDDIFDLGLSDMVHLPKMGK